MDRASLFRLVALGAIWGGSFALQRVAVPVFGAAITTEARLALAALFLSVIATAGGIGAGFRRHWRHFLFVGLFNSALPFLLFAFAAGTLPASLLAVFNSLAPIWGAVIAYFWLEEKVGHWGLAGLAMGFLGVVAITSGTLSSLPAPDALGPTLVAIAAGIAAPFCYGLAGTFIKSRAAKVDALPNALGSMWTASALLLPLALAAPLPGAIPAAAAIAVLALGLVCTGLAYILSFRLIADLGPMRAMTVAYLIPLFGIMWGIVFLNERVTPQLLLGGPLIVLGTALATGLIDPRRRAKCPA